MDVDRYRKGDPISLSFTYYDDNGVAQAIVGAATATVYDGAGAAVTGVAGAATLLDGAATFSIDSAALTRLDTYKVLWAGGIATGAFQRWTYFELADGYLFELADFRNYRAEFADTTNFPAARLRKIRAAAEESFENGAMVAFIPRGARQTLTGDGGRRLQLERVYVSAVYSASIDGTALTAEELAELTIHSHGVLERPRGKVWTRGHEILVHYVHGHSFPIAPVVDAVMELAAAGAVPSNLNARATSESTEFGAFRLTIAGRDGETGIPNVDAAMLRYGAKRPAVG